MGAVEIATAYVALVPTTTGIQSTVATAMLPAVAAAGKTGKEAGSKFGGQFGSGVKGAVGIAGAVAVGAAAVNLVKGSVAEAREAQKVGAVTNSIIKSTGGAANLSASQVGNLATSISNKTGVDDEAIQSGANLLLTFKNVREEAGKGNDVFSRATAAAADLSAAGFGSMESGSKMLGKALNDPVKGITALSRAGVTFTDQQKDQIKTLVETGDVLGAQKIILGEVESQVGGTAAASATAGEKASVAWGNFKETLGTALLPTIDKVQAAAVTVFGFLAEHQGVVTALAIGIGILATALAIATIAQWAMNSALLANPLTWIILGIVAIIAGIILLVTHIDVVKAFFVSAFARILAAIQTAWTWVKANWPLLLAILTGPVGLAVLAIAKNWDAIKGFFTDGWHTISQFFTELPGKVKALFVNANQWLYDAGKAILEGLIKGIKAAVGAVVDSVKGVASSITSTFKGALGIHSPSTVFAGFGENIGEGIIAGADRVQSRVSTRIATLVGAPSSLARTSAFEPAAVSSGLGGRVTLLDQDGSILATTRVVADGAVVGAQTTARRAATRRGLRSIAIGA